MSVLEKKSKGVLDDTIPLKASIEKFVNVDGHTEFVLKVQRGPNTDNCWKVQHRYNDFVALHTTLSANTAGIELPFPPKKAFGNMDSTFVHERRVGLQKFLMTVLCHELFAHHASVKKFLDPQNYSEEIEKVAQQQAAMFFRSEPKWELQEKLKDIGWRVRKSYFMIKSKDASKKTKHVLAWVENGPDSVLDHETTLLALLRQLTTLQHPFIAPVVYASCTSTGSTMVRQLNPTGSLRDIMGKAKPSQSYLKKCGNPKTKVPLDVADVKRIGRQVLEALKFLRDKGWPYGHLHAGNVSIEGQNCRLNDVENSILGLASIYRPHLMELKAVKDLDAIDVYCFGHFLHEIATGFQLHTSSTDEFLHTCPAQIKTVLQSILSTSAVKEKLPTLEDLISNPLFSDVPISYEEKPSFKVNKLKEPLKQVKDAIESRLKEDQKKLRQFHRLTKARLELLSEEEKKKRKKSSKKKVSSSEKREERTNPQVEKAVPNPTLAPPPPPVQPPTKAAPVSSPPPPSGKGRGALLSSINTFGKGGLKKCQTNDRSAPKV